MRFTFNEVFIINLQLATPDKKEFLYKLIDLEKYTDDMVLKDDLNNLIKKIEILSTNQINQLYKDRINYKIATYPIYTL